MLEGSIPIALIFKIHYKAMFSAFASKHKFQSQTVKPYSSKLTFLDQLQLFLEPSSGEI
jgi:hypothetical protein